MQNPHIVRKTTNPTSPPPEAGIHWINTVTHQEFLSVGTDSVTDWLPREPEGVWLSGSGVPSPSIGSEKDYYHNTDNDTFYKKLIGSWILFGVVNHSNLGELTQDNHPQYHTDARGDIRYYTKAQLDAGQLDVRYYTQAEIDALISNKAVNLSDLDDVSITSPQPSQALLYIGGLWKNQNLPVDSYTPAVPSNWSPAPSTSVEALDQLATRADSGYQRVIPTNAGSILIQNNKRHLFLDTSANLATQTITMPSSPADGLELTISCGTYAIAQLTLVPNSGQGFVTQSTAIRLPSNSAVTYRWMAAPVSRWVLTNMSGFMSQYTNGFIPEEVTLTMQNIIDGQVILSRTPVLPSAVRLLPDGGIPQRYGVDYAVVGNILTWQGLGLDGFLEEDDILYITY
jgi:hypothetical protein